MVLEHKGLALSDWKWAERQDKMPQGLLDAARADLRAVYAALEHELADRDFISGTLSVADIALLPHLAKRQGDGDGIFRCPGRGRPCRCRSSVARRTMRTRRSAHTPDTEPPSPLVRV